MEIIAVILGAIVAVLCGRMLFGALFDDADDFWDCVKFSLTPDFFSLMRGQYFRDMTQSVKLGAFILGTLGSGGFVYWAAMGLLGRWWS